MTSRAVLLSVLVAAASVITGADDIGAFPQQFSALATITSHLIDPEQEYPPPVRSVKLDYDLVGQRVRVEILKGYEAGRTYIRNHASKQEYQIKTGNYPGCKRAYLGEPMQPVEFPAELQLQGKEELNGNTVRHYSHSQYGTVIHMWVNDQYNIPVALREDMLTDSGASPVMTYDLADIVVGPIDEAVFGLPAPYTHESCERYIGGFPYVYMFHYYLRV